MARIIAITGIDGSGKTSTARNLQKTLADAGFRAQYEHQFNSVFARVFNTLRALLPTQKTKPSGASVQMECGSVSPSAQKTSHLKRAAAYAFLLFQALASNRARLSRHNFLIYDRYFYDDFVRMCQRYSVSQRYLLMVEKLVPRPVLFVTLEGDARETYNRQVDIDSSFEKYVEKLRIHNATIDQLRRLGHANIAIDTTKKLPPEVLKEIMRELEKNSII